MGRILALGGPLMPLLKGRFGSWLEWGETVNTLAVLTNGLSMITWWWWVRKSFLTSHHYPIMEGRRASLILIRTRRCQAITTSRLWGRLEIQLSGRKNKKFPHSAAASDRIIKPDWHPILWSSSRSLSLSPFPWIHPEEKENMVMMIITILYIALSSPYPFNLFVLQTKFWKFWRWWSSGCSPFLNSFISFLTSFCCCCCFPRMPTLAQNYGQHLIWLSESSSCDQWDLLLFFARAKCFVIF